MREHRRPIDDPEVRQQHRQQLRARMLRCTRKAFTVAAVFFAMVVVGKVLDHRGPRVPATVVAVNPADSTVTVSSRDPEASGTYTVRDTDAYPIGDRVAVVCTGEDQEPTFLSREPLLLPLVRAAAALSAFAVVCMAPCQAFIWWKARRRRRLLTRPWRRARVELSDRGPTRRAHVREDDGCTSWLLSDLPEDLPGVGALDAEVAGSDRSIVVRFFGSTRLATGRRVRQPTGESAMSAPRCTSVGVSDPRSSSSCLASRK